MSRPQRINLAGCVYHIICRGNRNDVVFGDNKEILHWFGNRRKKYIKFVRKGLDSEVMSLILFIMDMRKETEWTFRHIGRYLKLSARHVQKLYLDAIKKVVK